MAKHDKRVKYQSEADKPVMLSLRVPRELNDRLERYASAHRQHVSELVRDAIEMRLDVEADPRSRRAGSPADEPLTQIDGASILRDMQATLARHDTQMHALMQAVARQAPPAGTGLSEDASYGVIHSHTDGEPVESQRPSEQAPAFDPAKRKLGKLCPGEHEWGTTGQTLLRLPNLTCPLCEAASKREKRQAKRQEL